MASTDIVNSVASSDVDDMPQWKKELMYDRKTYARTLTSSSGNIKLTVTCPKSLRPKLKKQITSTQTSSKVNSNGIVKINEKEETINKLNTLKLSEDSMFQQNNVCNISTTDEMNLSTENFPKPGTVQTLKSKYLSLMKTGKVDELNIEKRSSSFESMLDSKNPFLEEIRQKSLSISGGQENLLQTADNDEYPKPYIVSKTKKLFEISEQTINYSNTNPFLKPPLMPKPQIKPRRIKPTLPPNKPALTSSCNNIYRKTSAVNPFCNGVTSPTSPIKSGRNLY